MTLRGEKLAHAAPGGDGFWRETGCIEFKGAHGVIVACRQPTPSMSMPSHWTREFDGSSRALSQWRKKSIHIPNILTRARTIGRSRGW